MSFRMTDDFSKQFSLFLWTQNPPSGYYTAYEKSSSTSKSFESNHWENRLKKEVSGGGGILTEKESKKGKRRV